MGDSEKESDSLRSLDATVDEAGKESFPASDPPPWPATHVGAPSVARGPEMFHDVVQRLRDAVRMLSETIGERNVHAPHGLQNLDRAAETIEGWFRDAGLPVKRRGVNEEASNIEAVVRGGDRAGECVVVGAHYDSPRGSPGAEDNASGVAVLLALAHSLQDASLRRTVRLVAFAPEPAPHGGATAVGSACYLADLQRQGPRVTSMLSLESLGLFKTHLPWPLRLVPALRSDLLMIGDRDARSILRRAKMSFDGARTPVALSAVTLPLLFTGIRSSDHWSFAKEGIPAFMVTDTAPLWSSDYRAETDSFDRLDYDRLAHVSAAIAAVVRDLASM